MLAQIAEMEGYPVVSLPLTGDPAELIRAIVVQPGDVVCVSSLPPFALLHARKLSKSLREHFTEAKIIVGQ